MMMIMIINSTSQFLQISKFFGGEQIFNCPTWYNNQEQLFPATVFARKYSQNFNPRLMPAFLS